MSTFLRKTHARAAAVCLGLVTAAPVAAGPITPPPGPVASTHKTLTEVEPRIAINATNTPGDADSLFKITQPGSYYLTGNITGVVGKHGIEIASSGVTLDLNGFDLVGVPAMGSFDGVSVGVGGLTNIAVVNGSTRAWGRFGVNLSTLGASNCRITGVLAVGNAGGGISAGSNSTILNCSAQSNIGVGISTSNGCTVTGCSVSQNSADGIATNSRSTITGCVAWSNAGNGINASGGCTVADCSATQNSANGILVGSGGSVLNCSAQSNGGNGIAGSSACLITKCSVSLSLGNSGITVGTGSTVTDCAASFNTRDGILCSSACIVRDNTCALNGDAAGIGAGIHATGGDNRIESNNCIGADRGIDVDSAGNVILRNSCSGNTTNWDIVANNVCGPIIDLTALASAAVSGNSAPDSTGSTHPNANFTY